LSRLFCQDQDQGQDFYYQDQDPGSQDQDQDFIFCPRGASRPRLWSRGLHHWKTTAIFYYKRLKKFGHSACCLCPRHYDFCCKISRNFFAWNISWNNEKRVL